MDVAQQSSSLKSLTETWIGIDITHLAMNPIKKAKREFRVREKLTNLQLDTKFSNE